MKTFFLFAAKALGFFFFRLYFRLQVLGRENFPKKGVFIIAANHSSFLDPPLVGYICPRRLGYFARASLFRNPVFAAILRLLGAFPAGREIGVVSLRYAYKRVISGEPLLIFPEGTRSRDGRLAQAMPGVGFLALNTGAPVIPVFIDGAYRAFPPKARFIKPTKIKIFVGNPIKFSGKDYHSVGQRIIDLIGALAPRNYSGKHGRT
ncbi:MAG: 1-acyl-sn-glycerol-3-phosphate acyltransferase [Candidatus Omnitrophica bacterium]|nr:1-acyl-sn-glycerol-3-phosphate acyltransferase [Candidatus Omnitrophota bacterium]